MKINNWLIADRCHFYRKGFIDFIKQYQFNACVNQTNSGKEALNNLITAPPTIVIANIDLEKMDGVELFRTVLHRGTNHHIFVFVSEIHWIENTYSRYANMVLWHLKEAGINYISSKEELDEETLNHLFNSIENNKIFISTAIQQSYNKAFKDNNFFENKLLILAEREREYLLHFANHKSQHEIAAAMHIEATTVNSYRERVLKKLALNSIDELKCFCSMYHLYNLNNYPPPTVSGSLMSVSNFWCVEL